MKLINMANPRHTEDGIILTITTDSGKVLDFHAMPTDVEDYGRELYARALDGEFGEIAPYIAPVKSDTEKLTALRSNAIAAITATDTVALRCLKNGVEFPVVWREYYRNLLRVARMDKWVEGSTLPEKPAEYPEGS